MNFTAKDRKAWVKLWGGECKDVVVVHFDYPASILKARVRMRRDHPTMPFGGGGRKVRRSCYLCLTAAARWIQSSVSSSPQPPLRDSGRFATSGVYVTPKHCYESGGQHPLE